MPGEILAAAAGSQSSRTREEARVAVGMLLAGEAVTADTYREVTEKMFGTFPMREEDSPDGLILHTAGQSEDGFYVYDVWESKEHFGRFVESKLGPALAAVGAGADGNRPEPQFYPIETIVKGGALAGIGGDAALAT
jgi:hypothetical protein